MLPGKGSANETENKVREGLELAVTSVRWSHGVFVAAESAHQRRNR
jgi:hypothetical protein